MDLFIEGLFQEFLELFKIIIFFSCELFQLVLEVVHIFTLLLCIFIEHIPHSFHCGHLHPCSISEGFSFLLSRSVISYNEGLNSVVEDNDLFSSPPELSVNMTDLENEVIGSFCACLLSVVAVRRHLQFLK